MNNNISCEITVTEIQNWLKQNISNAMKIDFDLINNSSEFERIGLDSITSVQIAEKTNKWYNINLDSSFFYDYNTIEKAALKIHKLLDQSI